MVGLQGIEAVVEGQQRVLPEGDDDGLVLERENGGSGLLGSGWQIDDGGAPFPLGIAALTLADATV